MGRLVEQRQLKFGKETDDPTGQAFAASSAAFWWTEIVLEVIASVACGGISAGPPDMTAVQYIVFGLMI